MTRRVLAGWGMTAPTGADVIAPLGATEVPTLLEAADDRGVLARGLGRAYGDAATNAGGTVLDMTLLHGIRSFDPATGTVVAEAGTSLHDLMRSAVPRGWFPGVTPGTRQVTLGGALAADVHGKNHHRHGTFSRDVAWFDLAAPAWRGRVEPGSDVFDATAGGMGLTGVVTTMALRLRPVETSLVLVDTDRAHDLDDLLSSMEARDDEYEYSVAWIDLLARGRQLGRGVLTRGNHAPLAALSRLAQRDPLRFDAGELLTAPPLVPSGALTPLTVRAFNELWFRRAPRHRTDELQSIAAFFHPLDAVRSWNRIYGRQGFVQYQFVVPFEAVDVLRAIVGDLAAASVPSFLAVLKRFGPAGSGHLSFPMAGWTLALDVPSGVDRLEERLRDIDERVAAAGGRVYLAKDARMAPDLLDATYPRLDEWRAVRDRLDPEHRLRSDLDRRLRLTGA